MRTRSSLPLTSFAIADDSFWGRRREINRQRTLGSQLAMLISTGRLSALDPSFTGQHPFGDSDVAKWLEAACDELASGTQDASLREHAVSVMEAISLSQDHDGYLGSVLRNRPEERYRDLQGGHELYTVGHILEACCSYQAAGLGPTGMLVARRSLDHLWREFGPQRQGYCGHPEIELALMRLWQLDGDVRAHQLAALLIDRRGQFPHLFDLQAQRRGVDPASDWSYRFTNGWHYYQAHRPVREQEHAEGHAVRALYLYCGMTDLAIAGDRTLVPALERLWDSAVGRRMYVTGGMGSTKEGERFGADYDLPDDTAYCETCAAIALARWAQRMLGLERRGVYGDILELALHNTVLAGVSLSGEEYFYSNPLAVAPHDRRGSEEHMQPRRGRWFGCACCPPNVARTLAQLGSFCTSPIAGGLAIHLYLSGEIRTEVAGVPVTLRVASQLPWQGEVRIELIMDRPIEGTIALRMPAWCDAPRVSVNGDQDGSLLTGYHHLTRVWSSGDSITLELPMVARRLHAHPAVRSAAGRVALQRGPLIYCLEQVDCGPHLDDLSLPDHAPLSISSDQVPGGCVTISARGERSAPAPWSGALYGSVPGSRVPAEVRAVPYCLWGNREPGEMRVWIRRS